MSKRKRTPQKARFFRFGGDGRDRTVDLLNAIQALSQLSYAPRAVLYYHIFADNASEK